MKNNFLGELFSAVILLGLLFLVLNPVHLWMPPTIVMMIAMGLLVTFFIFASFLWKEYAKDERERFHRMMVGRYAFLIGSGVLVSGIIVQNFYHALDVWLVIALGAMTFTKIIGLVYNQLKH